MPFVSNQQPDEEKQDPQNPAQGPVAPVGGGGAVRLAPSAGISSPGGGGGGSSGGAPSAGGSTQAQAGGQFGSLNQYLSAQSKDRPRHLRES